MLKLINLQERVAAFFGLDFIYFPKDFLLCDQWGGERHLCEQHLCPEARPVSLQEAVQGEPRGGQRRLGLPGGELCPYGEQDILTGGWGVM